MEGTKEFNSAVENADTQYTWKCKNQMLDCIRNKKNLWENMDDLSIFEKRFNNWDYDLIILDELHFATDYTSLDTIWIYNNIWMFARRLQKLLWAYSWDCFTYSVIHLWDELHIDINDVSTESIITRKNYVAKLWKLNQIEWCFWNEWYTF